MRWVRCRAAVLLVAALALSLSGCGDPEVGQRKAFVDFLQTRVLDRQGLRVPQPSAEESKAFGAYAEHFAVITGFHRAMNESVSPKFASAMAGGSIRTVGDLSARRGDIQIAKTTLGEMSEALGRATAEADAARGRLAQPPEVKAVYDKAYDRLVTAATATFREVVPAADAAFAKALDLAETLERNKAKLKVSGMMVQTSDRKLLDEVNAKLQSLQAEQRAVQEAQGKLRRLIEGRE